MPDLANVNTAFTEIVQISLPSGIRGLVIAAALAALMSTASAGLLAASTTAVEDLYPLCTKKPRHAHSARANRVATFGLGLIVLAIALLVNDVINALTLAYNLLVGGMLVPLVGAVYWRRATTAGAISSMLIGSLTAVLLMIKDGLEANTPIYYSLIAGLLVFVIVSLCSNWSSATPVYADNERLS